MTKNQQSNKIEVSNESVSEEDILYLLWNLQMENNENSSENTEPSHHVKPTMKKQIHR